MNKNPLATLISAFVQGTPPEIINDVLNIIQEWNGTPSDFQKSRLMLSIQNPQIKDKLKKLIDYWGRYAPESTSESICLSLRSSLTTYRTVPTPSLELIWTGPRNFPTTFRRTDQALLELIEDAKDNLLIVSFAVYKARPIIDAIEKAIMRNVNVLICLEDSNGGQGKLSFSEVKAFSDSIFKLASFYTWPIENRPLTADGKFGSLHAKIAVADQQKVFISSANLTDFAMDLNMEMGVVINDLRLAVQISELFTNLIATRQLKKKSFIK